MQKRLKKDNCSSKKENIRAQKYVYQKQTCRVEYAYGHHPRGYYNRGHIADHIVHNIFFDIEDVVRPVVRLLPAL